MKAFNFFKSVKSNETGSVAVDWVTLTAAIVDMGMVTVTTVGGGITGLGDAIITDPNSQVSAHENQ
ncbi:MAG: pilus assembly protein [bacterium]